MGGLWLISHFLKLNMTMTIDFELEKGENYKKRQISYTDRLTHLETRPLRVCICTCNLHNFDLFDNDMAVTILAISYLLFYK